MGLDFEMAIHEHYFEVLDVIEKLFEAIFNGLATTYGAWCGAVRSGLLCCRQLPTVRAQKVRRWGLARMWMGARGGGPGALESNSNKAVRGRSPPPWSGSW